MGQALAEIDGLPLVGFRNPRPKGGVMWTG